MGLLQMLRDRRQRAQEHRPELGLALAEFTAAVAELNATNDHLEAIVTDLKASPPVPTVVEEPAHASDR